MDSHDSCTGTNFEPNFDLNIDLDLECSQDTGTTMSSNKRKRFKVATEEDFDQLLSKQGSRNTKIATQSAVTCLKDFCKQTMCQCEETDTCECSGQFETMSKMDLATLLCHFYVGARSKSGDVYKTTTLNSVRFGLARYIKKTLAIDIISDPEFTKANEIFKAQTFEMKKHGRGGIEHHIEVEPEDLRKLYRSFNLSTPVGLQEKVR